MNSPRAQLQDSQLNDLINKIYMHVGRIADKHLKIRVIQWLDKIRTPTHNTIWKQNSILYAKVLLEMIQIQIIEKPFKGVPPDGPLPRLDKFDVPQNIWKRLKNKQTLLQIREPLALISRQYTPKMKTEPNYYEAKAKSHNYKSTQDQNQWKVIKESLEGADKNMQEFKRFLDHVLQKK